MATVIPGVATTASTSTNSTASTKSSSSSASDAASATLNYNSFMKLFMTELQNQDPTQPMDTTQQMAQLATFSQVEQQIKTNSNLTSLISQNMLSQAGTMIGKTVTGTDGTSGVIASIKVSDGATGASSLTATLTDGNTVDLGSGITISSGQ
jgi:flagellar basal-body rod modification protein FlgD